MNTYRVFFIKEKTEVTVKEGTTVLEAEPQVYPRMHHVEEPENVENAW